MADERYDISITKEYLIRNKAKLLYISSATYSGDWLSTPHTHYCSELFYVLEGIGQFQVEDKIFPVKALSFNEIYCTWHCRAGTFL